jgi:hypothetical protein
MSKCRNKFIESGIGHKRQRSKAERKDLLP